MTTWALIGWIALVGSIAGLSGLLIWLRVRGPRELPIDDLALGTSLLDRYQPLQQLLASDDLAFLSAQPGYRPEIGKQWRRQRARILRLYLSELKQDFRSLHAQARIAVSRSQASSEDLVSVLIQQQVVFWRAITVLEFRLALRSLGIGTVDIRPLIELIERMRLDLVRFDVTPVNA